MKSHNIFAIGALLASLALGGCKVGPNYKVPAMPAPPAYSDDGHNGNWTAASPADNANRGDWWTIYHDQRLNDLEQQCATANQNIVAALHAYEQAHDLVRENKASLYPTVSIGASANRNKISSTRPLIREPGVATNYWDFHPPTTNHRSDAGPRVFLKVGSTYPDETPTTIGTFSPSCSIVRPTRSASLGNEVTITASGLAALIWLI